MAIARTTSTKPTLRAMRTNTFVHLLGLGLTEQTARDLAYSQGASARDIDRLGPDGALNKLFAHRSRPVRCLELEDRELEQYSAQGYGYILITNFRVVPSEMVWVEDAAPLPHTCGGRPHADEWTRRVCEALMPGRQWKTMLMFMTLDDIVFAPSYIRQLYDYQSQGKLVTSSIGLTPDQTRYEQSAKTHQPKRPKLERDDTVRPSKQQSMAAAVSTVQSPWDEYLGRR